MTATIDIYDPDGYADGPPHELFAELRRTQPVFWQEMAGEPGYWAVLKHADVVHVAKEPTLFSANEAGVMLENLTPEALEGMRMMLLAMDPPKHVTYRRPLAPSFKARVMAQMEARIREICREIMQDAAERGEVEFVHEVTASLPTQVIGELMGLPREDWDAIHMMAERNTRSQDPEIMATADADAANGAVIDMAMYAIQFATDRRSQEPREDLTSLILATDFGGAPMNDIEFGSFFVQLVTAGNDTTQGMLANGLLALLEHPDQLADLRVDPSLTAGAVEEILRYENPLHYFRRTASADTELHGQPIAAGDKVARSTRPRTETKTSSPIHRRSTCGATPTRISRSASPSTSASACTSRGSRASCSSKSCSRRSRRSSSPANPAAPDRTSTTA